MMKKRFPVMLLSLSLAASLALGYEAPAAQEAGSEVSKAESTVESKADQALDTAGESGNRDSADSKDMDSESGDSKNIDSDAVLDKTVYVLTSPDGSVRKTLKSDWVKEDGKDVYRNTEGKDSGDDARKKDLPVSIKVTCFLDGQEKTPEQMKGAKGHVKLRYEVKNNQVEEAAIDGKTVKICHPYAVLTGLLLDNGNFRNVTVKNARMLNDGSRTVIAGITLPGMQESLGLDPEKAELPTYLEVEADTENFELGMSLSLVTDEVFRSLDTDKVFASLDADEIKKPEDIKAALKKLTDAMDQLIQGSGALNDGLKQLDEKSAELSAGVASLADGGKKVSDGAAAVSDGVAALEKGASALDDGTAKVDDGAGQVKDGAAALAGGTTELASGIGTLKSGSESLQNGLSSLSENSEALNGGASQIFAGLLAAGTQQLRSSGLQVPELTAENYGKTLDAVIASLNKAAPEAAESVSSLKASLDNVNTFCQGLATYTAGVDAASAGAAKIKDGLDAAKSGADTLDAGAAALSKGAADLKTGTAALKEGSTKLLEGSRTLNQGSKELKTGAAEISGGLDSLQDSMPALIDGIHALLNGSQELKDGLGTFNEEGVKKLTDAAEGNLLDLLDRMNAALDLVKSGSDKVKYIYRTDEIGK
ncbi:MAG: hypothetical protein IJL98_08695 [Lachnospiraceae bacterium]|nr:hypothetical protein [Lachnospiraceae bacterium]